jgi:hypothetical protein
MYDSTAEYPPVCRMYTWKDYSDNLYITASINATGFGPPSQVPSGFGPNDGQFLHVPQSLFNTNAPSGMVSLWNTFLVSGALRCGNSLEDHAFAHALGKYDLCLLQTFINSTFSLCIKRQLFCCLYMLNDLHMFMKSLTLLPLYSSLFYLHISHSSAFLGWSACSLHQQPSALLQLQPILLLHIRYQPQIRM